MAIGPRLDLRQSQSLVMTPQLQQAIRLLALSNLELEAVLAAELANNPLLESGDSTRANDRDPDGDNDAGPSDPQEPQSDVGIGSDELIASGVSAAEMTLDVDLNSETFHHDSATDMIADRTRGDALDGSLSLSGGSDGGTGGIDGDIDFDSFGGATDSLRDHLIHQAGETLRGTDHLIALQLIEAIDDAGYLEADLLDVAQRLNVPLRQVEQVLVAIQQFDPCGVGARSLAECIALQAKEADRYDPAMARLIDNLDLLARGAVPQLRRLCGVDDEDMADMIRELRGYDPKPGLRFAAASAMVSVVPDLFVEQKRDGWAIEINQATLPRLLVNRRYYAELCAQTAKDKGDQRAWLSDCLASANWLIKALDQRQQTILRVAREIVRQQESFFLHGVAQMRPLTLRAVADAIDMHESTVSRVTSNKYLACARGVFELKYFFTSGIQATDGGEGSSALAVKAAIRALVDHEGDKILSDEAITALLKDQGHDISRRTVVKYREAIGIGSSVQRRRTRAISG